MTFEDFSLGLIPHCDQTVLHAPGECEFCDRNPEWQGLRELWGIAFTGHKPAGRQLPCPSDYARGTGKAHAWGGNRPAKVHGTTESTGRHHV